MTDRWYKEAAELTTFTIRNYENNQFANIAAEKIKAALSAAHEAGRREEREACAQVADSERAVWGGDLSIAAFSARKAAEDIAADIRRRDGKE